LFKKCLLGFMSRWHGKHPVPWDFFYSFNNVSGMDLNWFWNAWFFSNNYIDLAVQSVRPVSNGQQIVIQNIGGFPVPLDIQLNFKDGSSQTLHRSPAIWAENQKVASVTVNTTKLLQSVRLVTDIYVDADESNNVFEIK
jgi:hypothetical protein